METILPKDILFLSYEVVIIVCPAWREKRITFGVRGTV